VGSGKQVSFRLGNATFSDSHKITHTPRGRMRAYMHTHALTLTHNMYFSLILSFLCTLLLSSAAAVYLIFMSRPHM